MDGAASSSSISRRRFLTLTGGAAALSATGCATGSSTASPSASGLASAPAPAAGVTWARSSFGDRFDPWIELDRAAWRNNVREASRLAAGRPILAVVKNNAYGLGDEAVGPLVADMPEVGGLACVRVEEAIAMREVGVTKPIVVMAETSEEEMAALVRHRVLPSVWLDDAPRRIERLAARFGRPIPVQLFVDTGMNREGMPYTRVRPWMEELARSPAAEIDATYTMFSHDLDFDRVQLERFEELLGWARRQKIPVGTLHASPTVELFHLPEAHYDMVRPGNALFGNYPSGERSRDMATLKPVFRLQTRVVRVERLEAGDAAGFYRTYEPDRPTWVGLLPVGRTDGYPSAANGTCEVLIKGRLYPVVGGVNSAHAIIDVGETKTVAPGDVATLIGPDHPAVHPDEVARRTETGFLAMIQGMNPRLPRIVV
ncbi:MAG: alanine racemase [Longimicrobiales bacterium]